MLIPLGWRWSSVCVCVLWEGVKEWLIDVNLYTAKNNLLIKLFLPVTESLKSYFPKISEKFGDRRSSLKILEIQSIYIENRLK